MDYPAFLGACGRYIVSLSSGPYLEVRGDLSIWIHYPSNCHTVLLRWDPSRGNLKVSTHTSSWETPFHWIQNGQKSRRRDWRLCCMLASIFHRFFGVLVLWILQKRYRHHSSNHLRGEMAALLKQLFKSHNLRVFKSHFQDCIQESN